MHEMWSEDLPWQARRGLELGRVLCTCDGCYHAMWGALRAAGVSNSLKAEEPLLASLISPFIRDDLRVMIGGSADPGVLCAIGRIHAPKIPAITVIDKCRAPLELIAEFSTGKGLDCRTLNRDLLDLNGSEQWDHIVLHYTSDFVDPRMRERLFQSLARALAPGGILVCASKTGTRVGGDRSAGLLSTFLGYSARLLKESPLADLTESPEFEKIWYAYAEGVTVRRLGLATSEETRELLRSAGFRVLSENGTARRQRYFEGAAIIDSGSVILATRD